VLNPPLVLLYHAVCAPTRKPDSEERDLMVDPDAFAEQMAHLAARGYKTLSLDEYAAARGARWFPPRSLLVTFDDAYIHVAQVVTPLLRRHGFTAVMFVPWAHLGGRNTWDAEHPNLAELDIATPELLKEMDAGPWEIASHGMYHIDLTDMEVKQRRAQLAGARERLSDLLGRRVLDLAYPYGETAHSVRVDARRAGYRMAFVAEAFRIGDPFQLPRLPIKGGDTPFTFRLKTSSACGWMYDRAPSVARGLARVTLQAAGRA
jgi:peptidoglycan/xylan/chitin deacetylase (PgdA/CDA1 family)